MNATVRTLVVVVAVAAVGAAGTLLAGAVAGMGGEDLRHLLALLAPAAAVSVAAALVARPLLARTSMRQRFLAVALIATVVALANLFVLTRQMFVSDHDGTVLAALLLYSVGSGMAAALVLARASSAAIGRLEDTARALGAGDLDARVGELAAGPELEALASTLDEMADRVQDGVARERRADRMRRDLITAVSHDLRTPLASVRAMVEAIDDGVVDDPESLRRYAREMRSSIDQLVLMVDDLFELTQLDAGAIEVESRRARLDEVVARAVAAVEPQIQGKGLALESDLGGAGDVPCSPRLARVLQNLLVNAVRHTPEDGSVRVVAARTERSLELAVEDTGEGIAPEDLERVFEPFFRSDPARSGPGAGLGLTLAKRIVEALGGQITARSQHAAGSRFEIELPIVLPS